MNQIQGEGVLAYRTSRCFVLIAEAPSHDPMWSEMSGQVVRTCTLIENVSHFGRKKSCNLFFFKLHSLTKQCNLWKPFKEGTSLLFMKYICFYNAHWFRVLTSAMFMKETRIDKEVSCNWKILLPKVLKPLQKWICHLVRT